MPVILGDEPILEGGGEPIPIGGILSFNPSSLSFGNVTQGQSAQMFLQAKNEGDAPVTITSAAFSLADYSFGTAPPFPIVLNPSATFNFLVQFIPSTTGARDGTLTFQSDATNAPHVINLTGTGIAVGAKAVSVDPSSWDFGQVKITLMSVEKTFKITNTGTLNVLINTITVGAPFATASLPSLPATITPGNFINFGAKFNPTVQGFDDENLQINGDQTGSPTQVLLSGVGVLITPAFTVTGDVGELLASFAGPSINVQRFNPTDLNCEMVASFKRRYDYSLPGLEKTLKRLIAQYEALGVASVTITFRTKRGSVVTVPVLQTSALTDESLQRIFADLQITDEVVEVEVSRAASSGPVQFTSFTHEFVPRGEIIKGT